MKSSKSLYFREGIITPDTVLVVQVSLPALGLVLALTNGSNSPGATTCSGTSLPSELILVTSTSPRKPHLSNLVDGLLMSLLLSDASR